MRIIHTSDWHLGHSLHAIPRRFEHDRFLGWLQGQLHSQAADVLIVAGDIFDSANPPASALAQFYRFLVETRQRLPNLNIVLIGGNHDSAALLDAPRPLLEALNIHLIGGMGPLAAAGDAEGEEALEDRLLVPLRDYKGAVRGWCLAVPFLRPGDLALVEPAEGVEAADPLIEAVRHVYGRLLDRARARRVPGQALIVTGHCYMVGGQVSELSERKVLGGNQHALPADIFPEDVSYVALGHLHFAQRVGGLNHVRYAGSPLPLAMDEADYPHQVLRVDIEGETLRSVEPIPVPRTVDLIRCPVRGHAPLEQVVEELRALQLPPRADMAEYPFLEVRVMLDAPRPGLRQAIDEAIGDKPLRLVRINTRYAGDGGAWVGAVVEHRLDTLSPEQVFARCHERRYGKPPADDLAALFAELLHSVREGA